MITFSRLGKYGSLGNQLFQYAALLGISKKTGHPLKIPKFSSNKTTGKLFSHGNNENDHPIETWEYSLNCFNIECDFLGETDHIEFRYDEPYFHFNDLIYELPDNIDIVGYFQSEKYFEHCKEEVRKQLTPRREFSDKSQSFLRDVLGKFEHEGDIISIHVRRGGCYKYKQNIHPSVPIDYYRRATQYFKREMSDPKFIVFSDDIEWCKENFIWEDFIFSIGNEPIVDLVTMTLCDHHIIANSSFSWWGAWLNASDNKVVIRPDMWFGPDGAQDTQDLCPIEWNRLDEIV